MTPKYKSSDVIYQDKLRGNSTMFLLSEKQKVFNLTQKTYVYLWWELLTEYIIIDFIFHHHFFMN